MQVYAPDRFSPSVPHKTALLARLMEDTGLSARVCANVGDCAEDSDSTRANRLPFIWAAWCFGNDGDVIGRDVIPL
jgi:hypothetical protein